MQPIKQITTIEEVQAFARQLVKEGVAFHPDEDFSNYINIETGVPTYTASEAAIRNEWMAQCFAVCEQSGTDIYKLMGDAAEGDGG